MSNETKIRLLDRVRLLRRIFDAVDERLRQRGFDVIGATKSTVPAGYVSGNLPIQQAFETSSNFGSKTHKVLQQAGNRNAAAVAGDPIERISDHNGNRWVGGIYRDVGSVITDADYFMGLRPVAPGNTLLLTLSNEQSTGSTSYVDKKRVYVTRPGKYRIKGAVSRTGGTTKAQVVIELQDGTKIVASGEASYSGTVYPTFGSQFTLDMTQPVPWGSFITIQLLNDSGPGQTGYIKDVTINYQDATASLALYDAVVTD